MAKFKLRIANTDSADLAQYDALAATAKRAGFHMMACGGLAELTQDQMADRDDSWVRFTALNAGITKFVETSVVSGVISKSHIDKNAALIAEKSKILARHGLKGYFFALEPQWLPEAFYEKHPQLRGPRCDHPGVARSKYYAPCIDQPEILAHYREGVRRLLEIAPEIGVYSVWTNDSGGGICWGSGLYSGKNGPQFCKDVSFGKRMRKWLDSILAGAGDAGRDIETFLIPVHFSPDEKRSTLESLPRKARLIIDTGSYPNEPFVSPAAKDAIAACAKARRGAILTLDPTVGYPLGPVSETPFPYFILDSLSEAVASGAYGILTGGVTAPRDAVDTMPTLAVTAGLTRPPKSSGDVERAVAKIAKAHVGERFTKALVSAWRDVDTAFRVCPFSGDDEHFFYTFYSIMGDRWLVRPLVPAPELVTPEEKEYFSRHRHIGRDRRFENAFFVSESRQVFGIDEYKWIIAIYGAMRKYTDRALAVLDEALGKADDSPESAALRGHRDRIATLAALWRTQRNVFHCGAIIEYMKSDRKSEFEKKAPTLRREFLEGMDDEIANCRAFVALLSSSKVPLINTGDVESSFVLPHNLPALIEKKIALMNAHRGDIDVLFPDCPDEILKDETYEDTDKKLEAEGL